MAKLRPSYSVRADWVLPIDQPAIRDGVVTVVGDRVASVQPYQQGQNVSLHVEGALLPAMVNAHTHLEFSGFEQPWGTPGEPFHVWLTQIIARRRQLQATPAQQLAAQRAAVTQGLSESYAAGVGIVGEIAALGSEIDWLMAEPRPELVVAFKELLGLASDTVEPLLAEARAYLLAGKATVPTSHSLQETASVKEGSLQQPSPVPPTRPLPNPLPEGEGTAARPAASGGNGATTNLVGLSPHAPYSVNLELLRGAIRLSAEFGAPLAMHLAESAEELELLQSHSGPLVEVLKSIGRWYPGELPRGIQPMDYLELLAGAHRSLVIHGNFLSLAEMRFVAQQPNMSVVYCPRTQARFNHGRYPLAEMLAAGVRVAIGSDSRSSNPDLSLWRELRHIAANHSALSPDEILKLGTLSGAEALGVASDWGSITPGKQASLLHVKKLSGAAEPCAALFGADQTAVRLEFLP